MGLGLAGIILFDNLSCDGTGEIAKTIPGVVVVEDNDGFHNQGRKNCAMTKMAMDRGADWILAIDADEFWYPATFATIPQMLAASSFDTFRVPGHNQVCTVFDDLDDPNPVRRMRWRCRADSVANKKTGPPPRIAYRCKPGRFAMHANEQTNDRKRSPIQWELLVRHYPVRSVEQFSRKAATAAVRPSAHLKKWYSQLRRNPDGFARFFWKKCVINTAKMRKHPRRWVEDPLRLGQRKWARRAMAKARRAARRSRIHTRRRAKARELRRKRLK